MTQTAFAAPPAETTLDAERSPLQRILDEMKPRTRADAPVPPLDFLCEIVREALKVKGGKVVHRKLHDAIKNWIAKIDFKISDQINPILHHPEFQKLESTWRGLEYLCGRVQAVGDAEAEVLVKVLNVDKGTLYKDLDRAPTFDTSWLFKKVYTEGLGTLGKDPFGLLIGDYTFSHAPADVLLMSKIAGAAAGAHAPFVAAAGPDFFGVETFAGVNNLNELANRLEDASDQSDYASWNSFRLQDESRYVTLTVPRVIARYPYTDSSPNRTEAFRFIEDTSGLDHEKYLWMNAAWAYAGRAASAFVHDGWFMRTAGVESGGKIEGLPVITFDEGGQKGHKSPVEVTIPDRRANELSNLGFLPVVAVHNSEWAVFMGVQTVQKAKRYFETHANASAEMSTKLNYLLCASRVAQCMYVLMREKLSKMIDAAAMQSLLTDWVLKFVISEGTKRGADEKLLAQKPLSDAKVIVEDVPGSPGHYRAKLLLKPHYMFEKMEAAITLVSEIKRNG